MKTDNEPLGNFFLINRSDLLLGVIFIIKGEKIIYARKTRLKTDSEIETSQTLTRTHQGVSLMMEIGNEYNASERMRFYAKTSHVHSSWFFKCMGKENVIGESIDNGSHSSK